MVDLISVVVPVYNCEKYLKRCIESILGQTYKNLEVILLNDGSTDKSLEISEELKEKDSRLKIVNKENEGVSKTRNRGIEEATGKYLMFIDSDDFIDSNYIELMYNYMIENDLKYVTSGMTMTDENGKVIRTVKYLNENKIFQFKNLIDIIVNTTYFCPIWKNLIDMDLIKKYDIKFETHLKFGEDLLFSYNLMKNADKIGYINNAGYYYVQNNVSVTHNNSYENVKKYVCDNEYVFNKIKNDINNNLLINNRLFTKYNFALLKLIKGSNYKEFKRYAIEFYGKTFDNGDLIDVKMIDYESKSNTILMRILYKKRYFVYYVISKLYYSFK